MQKIFYPGSHSNYFEVGSKEKNDFVTSREKRYLTIQKVSQILTTTIDYELMTQKVVDLLVTEMDYLGGIFFKVDEQKKILIPWTTSNSPLVNAVLKRLPKGIRQYSQSYDGDSNNLIARTFVEKKSFNSLKYTDFVFPALSRLTANTIQTLTGIAQTISFPVYYKDKSFGVIMFNSVRKEISEEEFQMLQTFSELVGMNMNNVELFSQIQNQVIQLTNKNKELTSLYNLASNVSQTLDPRRVSQAAVDSLPQDEKMLGAILASLDDKEVKLSVRAVSQNQLSYQVEKILGGFDRYSIDINDDRYRNNAYVKVIRAGTPYFTNDINDAFNTVIPGPLLSSISNLLGIKSLAIYPIRFRTKTVGVITYLIKDKTKEEIDTNQQQLLSTYSTQISVALENANLFTKSQVIQQNLENALKQLETLRNHERDMIDIMGHELRTPMSIVRNALVMLSEVVNNDPELLRNDKVKRYTDIGLESARREVTLIETLLSATKADGKGFQLLLEKVNMVEVIDASINAFGKECEKKGLYLKYEKPNEDMFVYTDRTRVQEIADNFLSNATKYTIKGGVEIKMYKENGFVFVDYLDTGMGISDDDIKRLGNKFFRAKQYLDDAPIQSPLGEKLQIVRPGGTGLGLYVTFNLIKILDGRLYIKSKLKVGSKFTFGMPIYNGQPSKQIEKKVEVFEAKPVQNTII